MAKENNVAINLKKLSELGFALTKEGIALTEEILLSVCRFLRNGSEKSLESLKKKLASKG